MTDTSYKILSIRGNRPLPTLLSKVKEFQPVASNNEIIAASIDLALNSSTDWLSISKYNVLESKNGNVPEFYQIRVCSEEYRKILDQIIAAFHLRRPPPASYVIKLLLINYIIYLENTFNKSEPSIVVTAEAAAANEKNKLNKLLEHFTNLSMDEKLTEIYKLLLEMGKDDQK